MSADGHGVVSHAGVGLLGEVADLSGLSSQVTAALADNLSGAVGARAWRCVC